MCVNSGGTWTRAPTVFKDVAGQHFSSSYISLFESLFLLLSALEIRTEELSRHFLLRIFQLSNTFLYPAE